MLRKGLVGLLGFVLGGTALAAPDYRAWEVGEGLTLTPSVDIEQYFDDNIFLTDTNEDDSLVISLRPGLKFLASNGGLSLGASYAADAGWYYTSSDDDYIDQLGRLDLKLEGSRSGLELYGWHEREHDARGTGVSNGFGNLTTQAFDRPAEFQIDMVGGRAWIGTEDSRFRAIGGFSRFDKSYQNFRLLTRDRDRDTFEWTGSVEFEVAPKTTLFIEGATAEVEYDFTPAGGRSLNSDENKYYAGLRWEATAALAGRVKFGQVEKDFDHPLRNDIDDASWEAGLAWSPRSYTTFDFSTFRGPRETDNTGNAVDVAYFKAAWNHDWSGMLNTDVSWQYTSEDYQGARRSDDYSAFKAGFSYDWLRNLTLGGGWRYSTRDSNLAAADFDQNVVYVILNVGI